MANVLHASTDVSVFLFRCRQKQKKEKENAFYGQVCLVFLIFMLIIMNDYHDDVDAARNPLEKYSHKQIYRKIFFYSLIRFILK